jgi:hypothetical protein
MDSKKNAYFHRKSSTLIFFHRRRHNRRNFCVILCIGYKEISLLKW